MTCLCCDFGGSSVKYALVDETAHIRERGKVPAPLESKEQFVDCVEGLFRRFDGQVDGIAVSMPGVIDADKGILKGSGAYEALYGENVEKLLRERCSVPVAVENDGKCGALSEVWCGALADCRDGVVIILGSAIAGAVIKDRKIHGGRDNVAGELSFLITSPEYYNQMGNAYMSIGMCGLTYQTCKAKNIDLQVQDASSAQMYLDSVIGMPYADPGGRLKKEVVDGVRFFKWLEEGDPDVVRIYARFIHALAILVLNVQICYAPEKIVIGGGLSRVERIFYDLNQEVGKYFQGMRLLEQLRPAVEKSRFLDECNLLGAFYNYMIRDHNKK